MKSEWRDCVGVCEAECGMDEEKVMRIGWNVEKGCRVGNWGVGVFV